MRQREGAKTTVTENLELSIIIPVLNEAVTLPALLACLARQRNVCFEVILCDGGSRDDTVPLAQRQAGHVPFPLRVVTSLPGRALQMNAGAAHGVAPWLLFLHADSLFTNYLALRTALDHIAAACSASGHDRLAGRFGLRFMRSDQTPSWGFYHLECKARLNRPECTHGDQGLLLLRECFRIAGPFDATFPMLAETVFADNIRRNGELLLLPAEIHTSARRFEREGLYERQVLNAILMNFAALGWDGFFRTIASLYSPHDECGRLQLHPVLRSIAGLIKALPLRKRLSLWYATGAYVRSHAWQLPFCLDTRRNFRRGLPPGAGALPLLHLHDRFFDRCTDHPPGRLAAACLTWLWFRLTCLVSALRPAWRT